MLDSKTFSHVLSISPGDHLNGFGVDAVDFLLPFVVTFLDSLFVVLLVRLVDWF